MLDQIPLIVPDQIPLAADPDWLKYWQQGDWFTGAFRPIIWRLSRPGAVLLLGGPFTLALWWQTESMIMPATLIALFMGLWVGGAPPGAALIGYILVVVATVLAYRSITGVGKGI